MKGEMEEKQKMEAGTRDGQLSAQGEREGPEVKPCSHSLTHSACECVCVRA